MSDQKTVDAYNLNAEDYHTRFPIKKPNKSLILFMEHLPKGAHVLDLGCGPGSWAAFIRDAGFSVDATDASEEMVKIAKDANNIEARVATFDDISGTEIYDGVWANFSLLHADRPSFPNHLKALHEALKPNGIFHIGMKLGSDANRDRLDRFYTYYEEEELINYLKGAGFEVIDITTGKEVGLAGNEDAFALILSRKVET